MDQRLYDAARTGDVVALLVLLNEDPLMLDKICLAEFSETPLHVAALAGETEFAKEIMRLMPCFAKVLNKDGFAPLHLASARGRVEVVMELLKLDTNTNCSLCLQRDKSGRIPLHYAIANGNILIIEKLIFHCFESLQQVTPIGETVLHLAVKKFQLGALKVVLERLRGLKCLQTLLSIKDCQGKGKTVAELAEATNQVPVLEVLKEYQNPHTDNDASAKSSGNDEIMELAPDKQADLHQIEILSLDPEAVVKQNAKQESKKERKTKPEEDNIMLVAAVLIATVTYQALVTPPSSIWEKGVNLNARCLFKPSPELKKSSFQKSKQDCPAWMFYIFLIVNTACFLSSVVLILVIIHPYNSFLSRQLSLCIILLLLNFGVLITGLSPDQSTVSIFFVPLASIMLFAYLLVFGKDIPKITRKFISSIQRRD